MGAGKLAGAALVKKGGMTTATSGAAATTGDEYLKIGTTHTTSQMSSLQDFEGDVVAWSFGGHAEVLRSPGSEFELEVQSGLNRNFPALIGLGLCSGSAETIDGEQHLLHCVLTCLTQAGEEFDPPLLLRFPVGDKDSMESGSLDGSHDDAEVAYRAHLESTFSAFKRHDANSDWVVINGDIVQTEEGDFVLQVKIKHFCQFGLGQKFNVGVGGVELVELPKLMFKSRKTHYHFVNLGTEALAVHVWGAGRKEIFVNVVEANAGVDIASGLNIGGRVERTLVHVPGSGPFRVPLPGKPVGVKSDQVCKRFFGLESPTAAWTTQEKIPRSSDAEGYELVQVWGKTHIASGYVLAFGPMRHGARPEVPNLKVMDGEPVGRLVWSKMGFS
ncbi:unnamed protein product [Ectocarpus sp. 12 AP-2014]